MSNAQAFVLACCICAFGGGLIWLAVYLVTTYSDTFKRHPERSLFIDLAGAMTSGPWGMPVALAVVALAIGCTALSLGSSIALHIIWRSFATQ